jgi:hypothetical protein
VLEPNRGAFPAFGSGSSCRRRTIERCVEIGEECAAMKSLDSVKQQLNKHEPCRVPTAQVQTPQGIARLF